MKIKFMGKNSVRFIEEMKNTNGIVAVEDSPVLKTNGRSEPVSGPFHSFHLTAEIAAVACLLNKWMQNHDFLIFINSDPYKQFKVTKITTEDELKLELKVSNVIITVLVRSQ